MKNTIKNNTILTHQQKIFLLSMNDVLRREFYLTGGTALTSFYLQHRLSDDLDFFREKENDFPSISYFMTVFQKLPDVKDINYQRKYDRRMFLIKYNNQQSTIENLLIFLLRSHTMRRLCGSILAGKKFIGKICAV